MRKKKRGRPRKICLESTSNEGLKDKLYINWDEIKQKKYGKRYEIILGDQAPRIGSGLRIVYVQEKRKWAYMTRHVGDPDIREGKVIKRFKIKEWEQIKAQHKHYLKRNDPDEVKRKQSKRRYRRIPKNA